MSQVQIRVIFLSSQDFGARGMSSVLGSVTLKINNQQRERSSTCCHAPYDFQKRRPYPGWLQVDVILESICLDELSAEARQRDH
jgi:hypothetical protein